ncbi:Multiple C2 and transmembrane domain-containing protein 1 [Seminavis robusta]|uniref:Multiple C2 and transmembrane domain-containing protein 1 n=1 Tax=Seminavis robusta TaxID=568900 RepID=A0A9N8D7C7_9STRA|nr:Multiple C2 and transmembrane domain-containing protein 1 [Seminavis robusta]|eukprot:Sro24_g016360.1 Multiple C2 and transmembrane domain-containing protein 1 (1578) ;mRNA; f:51010-57135
MAENPDDHVCLYIEILACSDLLIRDRKAQSSDPYVKVKLAGKDIHQTKTILKNLNPVFGDAEQHAFLLDCPKKQLIDNQGLLFKVKDWNRFADQDIGSIQVSAADLTKASGETMEYVLEPPSDVPKDTPVGTLTIGCWQATDAHLEKLGKDKKGLRGFVSGIQSKAHDITHKAEERMKDLGDKMHVKEFSQALTPSFMKKDEETPKPFGSAITDESEKDSEEKEVVNTEDIDEYEQKYLEEVLLVVEVVAGRNLLIGDKHSSDPYVKVMMGEDQIHKTKHILKTLNPIYTPEIGSTFLLECPATDLADQGGLNFIVKDWDRIGVNDDLGTVDVSHLNLTKATGEAMEFMIEPPKGVNTEPGEAGYLLIRCRKASKADAEFLKDPHHVPKNMFPTTTKEAASSAWASLEKQSEDAPELKVEPKTSTEEDPNLPVPDMTDSLHIRIEIVKCRNLIAADRGGTSDPYVKVKLANKDLHETKHILKTLNPLFSDETDSTFVLHCLAKDLYDAKGLQFKCKDYDRLGKSDELGTVQVPPGKIYNGKGEDLEFDIAPPKGQEGKDAGSLTIRCSATTADDHTGERKKFLGMKTPQIEVPKIAIPTMKPLTAVSEMLHLKTPVTTRSVELDEPRPLFIEIVSCRKLLGADKTGLSDPYVKIKLGKQDLHQTKHLEQTLEPIFEPRHNPYFVLDANPAEVRQEGGILLKVKDYDMFGKDDDLGEVLLEAKALYEATGEKTEVKLNPPKGKAEEAGFISFRCRPATADDRVQSRTLLGGLTGTVMPKTDYGPKDLSLLIEIVSGWRLPIADLTSSDPYVKIRIGSYDYHRTKPIKNTRDPIYTIQHQSLFILEVATKEIKDNDGITFEVKDYDFIGSNDMLGTVVVPPETILEAKGERLELQLKNKGNDAGFLAVRCRPATNYDREFLQGVTGRSKKRDFMGLNASYDRTMAPKGGGGNVLKTMFTRNNKTEHGVKKYRVRPFPDPERKADTEFMSEKQIEAEALKDSRTWLDVGSGDLGKVYCEIIGCDGLPNKDQDLGNGNKTDSFAAIVYEDVVVKTDVIDDCLSPRWLPWMQRAFIFRMMHPSSNLNICVFDYDPGFAGDHDICGRVSIDLANLVPGTEYVLRYKLYENSAYEEREPKGILMVRLRMELKGQKDMLMSYLQYPGPQFFVNVKSAKDFDLVRQTVGGRQDLTSYSTKTIGLYVEELTGYSEITYYISDTIVSLLFWREQVKMFGIWVPLHSLVLFLSAIILAERPTLYPAFYFFSLGWSILAVGYWRNNSSNPWDKTQTAFGLLTALITGVSIHGPPKKIGAHEKEEESKAEQKAIRDKREKLNKQREEVSKAQVALAQEHQSQMSQVGEQSANTDISTNAGGVSLDPLKVVLYPLQLYLGLACRTLRLVKNVLIWDEPYVAFILTFVFFGIGFVLLFVPWLFLFRWTSRLIAWGLLGPHMKLADIYWYRDFENMSEEEQAQQIRDGFTAQLDAARALAAQARIDNERAIKLKDIKKELYGKFVTWVPVLSFERFPDVPLHSSSAQPYTPPENQSRAIPERVAGQHLVGDMIPRIMDLDDPGMEVSEEAKKND